MGRNKDPFWQYAIRKKGKKYWECIFCKQQFAGGASRIKAHFSGTENKGITACPKVSEKVRRTAASTFRHDNNKVRSKDRLIHPEKNIINSDSTSGSSRDRCNFKEATWKQKTREEVDINKQIKQFGKQQVGPFFLMNMVNARDSKLIEYVFDLSRDKSEIIISSLHNYLSRTEFTTLQPRKLLNSAVIDIFSEYLTEIERKKKSKQSNWYLPVMFSSWALCGNISSFLEFVEGQNMRENYMSELADCEQMFIPVHINKSPIGHFYLYVVDIKNQVVEMWDSLPTFLEDKERRMTTHNLLLALDYLFLEELRGARWAFGNFHVAMAKNTPVQPNEHDCGIFVMHFMQQLTVTINFSPQFDSDEERFKLALKLLKSDFNKQREALYNKTALQNYADGGEDAHMSKRKRVSICKTLDDVQGDEYKTLDVFTRRTKKNVSLYRLREESDNSYSPNGSEKGHIKCYPLPTTDLIGEQFQSYTEKIWEWLKKEEVSVIGLWGMGGVGKTALVTHIHNQLLERDDVGFDHVIWITVSQQDSVNQLQKAIAEYINLDISNVYEEKRIEGRLLHAFKHINKCVLILDDVWNYIPLDKIGFPISNNGNKLVLTTRSLDVCQSMNCKESIINIQTLDEEGAWDLFEKTVEENGMLSGNIVEIALDVAKKCFGLPLMLVTIARCMKGNKDTSEWRHMLERLRNSMNKQYDMGKWVVPVLRSSYDSLKDKKLQKYFLYITLNTMQFNFITFVSTGFIGGKKRVDKSYDEYRATLIKLYNNSLMEIKKDNDGIFIDAARYLVYLQMANSIAKKNYKVMVSSKQYLTEIPDEDEWKEDLLEVWLMGHKIQVIPDGTCPRCPNLSTFLLHRNHNLRSIPDDFFVNMTSLRVLNLSYTSIEFLPTSVSNLECLITLWLEGCERLCYVPSLAKLRKLMHLSLCCAAITKVPHGLEMLINLRWLDLRKTQMSFDFTKMTKLHSLHLNCTPGSMNVRAQDLPGLKSVGSISAHFWNSEEFNAYLESLREAESQLFSYYFGLGTTTQALYDESEDIVGLADKKVIKLIGQLLDSDIILPEDVNRLIITHCNSWQKCLCDFFHDGWLFENREIESCDITLSSNLNFLFCISTLCDFCQHLELTGNLILKELEGLHAFCEESEVMPSAPSSSPASIFLHLKNLRIEKCNSLKKLLTPVLSTQLQNLETITVIHCQTMEEIFSRSGEQEDEQPLYGGSHFEITVFLPKLKSICLEDLPELHFVYNGIMVCRSLTSLTIRGCNNLKSLRGLQSPLEIQETVNAGSCFYRLYI